MTDIRFTEVAFGTGGELAGEIFVYLIPASLVRPGMSESDASAITGSDPEIRTYADRGNPQVKIHPMHVPVWSIDGDLILRGYDGEPIEPPGDVPERGPNEVRLDLSDRRAQGFIVNAVYLRRMIGTGSQFRVCDAMWIPVGEWDEFVARHLKAGGDKT
jgi:hypothetical protein